MSTTLSLLRPDLHTFKSYSSARDEAANGKIWLNANELPFNLVSDEESAINRYPSKQPRELIEKLAALHQVKASQLVMTRGSDEGIDLLMRLFCVAGKDAIMICPPTFGMYEVYARLQGASVVEVPLCKQTGFSLNLGAVHKAWNPTIKLIFLCSPNNPTGNLLNVDDVMDLCKTYVNKSLIVIDEAYIDFADEASFSRLISDYDNLVVLKTFSKGYGLAGARCGTLFANDELVEWILRVIAPYPLPSTTIRLVMESIEEDRLIAIKSSIALIRQERERMLSRMQDFSFIKNVWPSQANFLLIEVADINKVLSAFAEKWIIVRSMHTRPSLENCLRITIGTPAENAQVVRVLEGLKYCKN